MCTRGVSSGVKFLPPGSTFCLASTRDFSAILKISRWCAVCVGVRLHHHVSLHNCVAGWVLYISVM